MFIMYMEGAANNSKAPKVGVAPTKNYKSRRLFILPKSVYVASSRWNPHHFVHENIWICENNTSNIQNKWTFVESFQNMQASYWNEDQNILFQRVSFNSGLDFFSNDTLC
jgi:hypothetical protein